MKKFLTTLAMLALCTLGLAQDLDSLNQNKYWVYRDRFQKFFTHIGGQDDGESLPMDVIRRNYGCGDIKGDRIESGDVMAAMGEYLGVLATEYALLARTDDYEKLTACKHELFYALRAIDRVDRFADLIFFASTVDTKGFFVRDDILENYYKYWEETDNMAYHGAHATAGFIPDSILVTGSESINYPFGGSIWLWANDTFQMKRTDDPAYQGAPFFGLQAYKDCPPVRDLTTTISQPALQRSNEMSQDHALGIMIGLKFVQKFINDENLYIRPTPQDSGMWVMAETRLIATRIMDFISQEHPANSEFTFLIKDSSEGTPESVDIEFKESSYLIINPITGLPVDRGWEAFFMSGGYRRLAEDITGLDYSAATIWPKSFDITFDKWWKNGLLFMFGKPSFKLALNTHPNWAFDDPEYWEDAWDCLHQNLGPCLPDLPLINGDTAKFDDVAMNMVMRLGAVTGSWNHSQYVQLADEYNFPWFDLMYASVNNLPPIKSKSYYENLFDSADCSGVSKWARDVVLIDTLFDGCGRQLYSSTGQDSVYWKGDCDSWDDFVNEYHPDSFASEADSLYKYDTTWSYQHHPFNKSSIFSLPGRDYGSVAWIDGDFNGLDYMLLHNFYRLSFSDSISTETRSQGCPCQSTVAQMYGSSEAASLKDTITSLYRFPEYQDIGIDVPEFITHDLSLYPSFPSGQSGHIRPGGNLTICGAHVELFQPSSIRMQGSNPSRPKKLRVNNGGVLELNSGSSLIIDTFSRVIIEPGGKLVINPNCSIIIDRGAYLDIRGTLELKQGAVFSITTGTYGQGYVRFKNNGPNSATARALVIAEANTQFKLSGPYQGYKIMEIDGDHSVVFPENMVDSITKGAIELGGGSSLEVHGSLLVEDMDVIAKDTNTPYAVGFLTLGQEDVVIKKTDFSYGMVGISCHNYINQNTPKIDEIEMKHMDLGVYTQGLGFDIQGAFDNCGEGIYVVKPSIPGVVHNTRLENGSNGIVYDGQSTGSLRLRYGTVKDNDAFGLYGMNGSILLVCSNFDGNNDGLYLEHNPLVSINQNQQAGGNIFKNNTSYVMHEGVGGLQLDLSNGYTSFTGYTDLFSGYLRSHSALNPPLPPGTMYQLSSSFNFWDDSIAPYQYDLKYYIGNQGKLNAATVNLDHTHMFTYSDSLSLKQVDICPAYGTTNGQFETKGAGSRNIDQDNQSVTNTYYLGESLSEVFEDINERMYFLDEYYGAYQRCKSIMDYSLSPLSKFDQYVVSRAYRTMMEGYGRIFYDTSSIDKVGLTGELLGTLEDLELKGQNSSDSFWASQNLQIAMDIAEVYRMNDKRDTAIMVLSDKRIGLTETADLDNIDNFICVINAEIDVLEGNAAIADHEAYACYSGSSSSVPNYTSTVGETNSDKPKVDWSPQPNPAETGVEVVFNLKTKRFVEIEVYDILGHKLAIHKRTRYKKGLNKVHFDVNDWPTGMYFVKFNYDGFTDSKRLLIQHNK